MINYGKIHTSMWSSETFKALSDDGKMLAIYLLANPHGNMLGVFRLPNGYVMEDLQWGSERVSKGFLNCSDTGFASRENGSNFVVIEKFLDFNGVENPNQLKAALKIFTNIPDSIEAKGRIALYLYDISQKFDKKKNKELQAETERVTKGFRKGSRNVAGISNSNSNSNSNRKSSNHNTSAHSPTVDENTGEIIDLQESARGALG